MVDVVEGLGEVGWERVSGCEGVPGNVDGDGAVAACGGDQASDGPAGGGLQPAGHGKGCGGLLGVFRTVLVLCFRLPSSGPGNRFQPRRECDTLGLSEDEYDCISARSTRQYP